MSTCCRSTRNAVFPVEGSVRCVLVGPALHPRNGASVVVPSGAVSTSLPPFSSMCKLSNSHSGSGPQLSSKLLGGGSRSTSHVFARACVVFCCLSHSTQDEKAEKSRRFIILFSMRSAACFCRSASSFASCSALMVATRARSRRPRCIAAIFVTALAWSTAAWSAAAWSAAA